MDSTHVFWASLKGPNSHKNIKQAPNSVFVQTVGWNPLGGKPEVSDVVKCSSICCPTCLDFITHNLQKKVIEDMFPNIFSVDMISSNQYCKESVKKIAEGFSVCMRCYASKACCLCVVSAAELREVTQLFVPYNGRCLHQAEFWPQCSFRSSRPNACHHHRQNILVVTIMHRQLLRFFVLFCFFAGDLSDV